VADGPFTLLPSSMSTPTAPPLPSQPPLTSASAHVQLISELMNLSLVSVDDRMKAISLIDQNNISLSDLGEHLLQLTGPSQHLSSLLQAYHTTATLTTSQIADVL